NLQRLPLPTAASLEELTYEGHDISFFDDLDALSTVFQTQNTDTAGELLIDFFRYFSKEFNYTHTVVSIRSEKGTMQKVAKGWHTDFEFDPEVIVRDQHKLCIEDPFQLDYNVARTVTRDGLYTIRGEFMRAFRILTTPARGPNDIGTVINSLCEEREDYLLIHPADAPYPHQHQPHHPHAYHPPPHHQPHPHPPPHSHAQHLQPQAPKSPRRRSAPSPRMGPSAYTPGLHHQPQQLHPQRGEHPLWAAATNGAAAVLAQPGGAAVPPSRAGTSAPPSEADEQDDAETAGEAQDARTPTGAGSSAHAPALHPPPASLHQAAPRRPPSSYGGSDAGRDQTPTLASTASLAAGLPGLERRSSWDGMREASPAPGAVAGSAAGNGASAAAAGGGGAGAAAGGAYDLHRFFQNPPSSSVSDVGGPTASTSSSSASAALSHPRGSVSLTAPSSPDMAASSAYFAGHPPAYGYAGRPAYRYASTPGAPYSSHVGPRLAASVPRNPHTAHHAFTNPYASAPAPAYPLSSSASSSSSSSYAMATSHLGYASLNGSVTSNGLPAPAPIFPEEDREAIALANSITFGNFPEMLPLPSYAHYHASGGSAAYLAGAGGWGTTPYGMSGPMRVGNRTHTASGGLGRRPGVRRSLGLGLDADEDDWIEAVEGFAGRGRRLASALEDASGAESSARPSRTRGRSVPHVRMGPDGRETLLFGAIEVTLPKAEDVEEAEREEHEQEQEHEEDDHPATTTEPSTSPPDAGAAYPLPAAAEDGLAAREADEREVAFLGPTPRQQVAETTTTAAASVVDDAAPAVEPSASPDIPPRAVRSIPLLTTQPATPVRYPLHLGTHPPSPVAASLPTDSPSS
ncbi:hypothetical protein JCM6882_001978, partial [Rhodosporidiobolus microsporus]